MAGLKAKLADLATQEGRLVNAVATGAMAPGSVAGKLGEIAKARQGVNDALAESDAERALIRQAAAEVGMWRDLGAYLDAAQGDAEFLDVAAVLGAVVREVRLDLARGRARVVFNLPCAAAESIGRKAGSGSEAEGKAGLSDRRRCGMSQSFARIDSARAGHGRLLRLTAICWATWRVYCPYLLRGTSPHIPNGLPVAGSASLAGFLCHV